MKRYSLIILLLLASLAIFAQTGLYYLSYDAPMAEADSLLIAQGFMPYEAISPTMFSYAPQNNDKVELITIVVEPVNHTLVGWLIRYNPNNTEEEDNLVFENLNQAHSNWFKQYEETGQIVWFLTPERFASMVYLDGGQLTVLYYDSNYDSLFHPFGAPDSTENPPEAE